MKIKIKVKNIILLILTTLFIILILAPYINLQIARFYDRRHSDKARIFYEKYLSSAIILDKNDALYNYADGLAGSPEKFQIMMSGWGGGATSTFDDMNNAANALRQILEKDNKKKKDWKYTVLSYGRIMDIYINTQSPEDLLYWIEWGANSGNEEINYVSDLYRSFYYFTNRDYDKAEDILDKYKDSEYADYRYYYMKGELALWNGDIELSKKLYKEGMNSRSNMVWNMHDTLFGSGTFKYRDYWLEEDYNKIKGDLRIRGRVSFNGIPLPFVEVYIQRDRGVFRSSGGDFVGITDINGEYETLGFESDRYEIGIGINQAMLHDKVYQNPEKRYIDVNEDMEFDFTFSSPFRILNADKVNVVKDNKFTIEWQEVEEAVYYKVNISSFSDPLNKSGGYITFPMEDENNNVKIKGSKAIFDVNKLKKLTGGISWDGEERIVTPGAILGYFIPGIEYPVSVNAYDEDGRLLSSSNALRTYFENLPSIKLEGELTEGEKLISQMKYEEAIDYYNNVLEDNPDNEEALLYLAKIYMISYKKDKEDYDKAMDYAVRYDKLIGSDYLKYEVIGFMDHNARRKHKDLIKEVLDGIIEDKREDSFYFELGRYYLSLREYELARDAFENAKSYNSEYTMYIDLYFGEVKTALDLINSGELDLYNMDKRELVTALEGIDASTIQGDEYKVIKNVIDKILSEKISYSQGREIYNEAKSKISNQYLRMLLSQINQDNHWDREYVD